MFLLYDEVVLDRWMFTLNYKNSEIEVLDKN